MREVFCSTGAFLVGEFAKNPFLIPEFSKKINTDKFELLLYLKFRDKTAELVPFLKDSGMKIPVVHVEKDIGEYISRNGEGDIELALEIFKTNCDAARELGAQLLVLHLWGGIPSDSNIEVNLGMYPTLYELAKQRGLTLTVESVPCNHQNPLVHMKTLFERYPDTIQFTLDTRFIKFHGLFEEVYNAAWLWRNNLVRHIHISDYKGAVLDWSKLPIPLNTGDGEINFEGFFGFLNSVGYDGDFSIECNGRVESGVDFHVVNRSIEYIKRLAEREH